MKKKFQMKKKFPEFMGPVMAIGLLILGVYLSDLLGIPGSIFCNDKIAICNVPLIGRFVSTLTSLSFWFVIIFYMITFGGFLLLMNKRGYKL